MYCVFVVTVSYSLSGAVLVATPGSLLIKHYAKPSAVISMVLSSES